MASSPASSSNPGPAAAAGVELFLRSALAEEPAPPRVPSLARETSAAWENAQAALAARFENDLAALAGEQRAELARLAARLAEAERTARDLASQMQELR